MIQIFAFSGRRHQLYQSTMDPGRSVFTYWFFRRSPLVGSHRLPNDSNGDPTADYRRRRLYDRRRTIPEPDDASLESPRSRYPIHQRQYDGRWNAGHLVRSTKRLRYLQFGRIFLLHTYAGCSE